ncbi:hypothetical protein [Sphingomonas sp.]
MSRLLVIVVLILALLMGATFFFAGRAHEQPRTHVEKAVDLANLS